VTTSKALTPMPLPTDQSVTIAIAEGFGANEVCQHFSFGSMSPC
jgi:hypothetical protein